MRDRSPLRQARHPEQTWDRDEASASEPPAGPVRLRERGEESAASHQAEGVDEEEDESQPRTVTLAEGPGAHNMASREAEGQEPEEATGQEKPVHLVVHKLQGQRSIGSGRSNWYATQRRGKAYSQECFPL